MTNHVCMITIPTKPNQPKSLVPIFVIDGIPVSYTIADFLCGQGEEPLAIVSHSALGGLKKEILSSIADKIYIHPVLSSNPEFIKTAIITRKAEIKLFSEINKETVGWLIVLNEESLSTAFYDAFGLVDENGVPKVTHANLADLGFNIKPPFENVDLSKI